MGRTPPSTSAWVVFASVSFGVAPLSAVAAEHGDGLTTVSDDTPLAIPGAPGPRLAPPPAHIAAPEPVAAEAFSSRQLSLRTLPGYATGSWFDDEVAWSVYRGAYRLDVPSTLNALGRLEDQRRLERRISRNHTSASVLTGVGVAGIATTILGLTGRREAATYDVARDWSLVSTAGLAMTVGGFISAAIPSHRARRLQFSHAMTQSADAVQRDVDAHNQRLAAELGAVDPPAPPQAEEHPGQSPWRMRAR